MMTGMIKVTPERLMTTAHEFSTQSAKLNETTDSMLGLVESLNCFWQGEASQAFTSRFSRLQDDMCRMYGMIQEHARDLEQMAENYLEAEERNEAEVQDLSADIII